MYKLTKLKKKDKLMKVNEMTKEYRKSLPEQQISTRYLET